MVNLLPLIQNEMLKVWKKKRFFVIVLILLALIPIFTYAELKVAQNNAAKFADWRNQVLQQIVTLFIPLLVLALGSDIVSSERTSGTIKMLLTRPIRRWKILLSKLIVLVLYVSLTLVITAILCYLISGLFFGYDGWTMPVFTGFQINGSTIDSTNAHAVPQWLYIWMQAGLVRFSAMTVALLAFMVSILIRRTAASLVTIMAAVITGTILSGMTSSWTSAKYLFAVNLKLTGYLDGSPPPIEGMSLPFSLTVLVIWGALALVVSFGVFTKQDILN